MEKQFDFEHYKKQAVEDLLSGKQRIDGPDGVLAPLLKQFLEAALDAEVKSHVESSKGMSYEGISQELYQIYGIEASPAFISSLTDKVLPMMEQWRRRPLQGVEDMLIVSVDGLKGFEDAIRTIFPQAKVQGCIVQQIRHSFKFVTNKDMRPFAKDLKPVYTALDEAQARQKMDELEEKWGRKYPPVIKSWRDN